ncbi:hypothetical protein K439DRAFT_1527776 [Ramaria rubella]|nr:hypothetical protein K439DRAFT_1527776 [Ramaria rubella]
MAWKTGTLVHEVGMGLTTLNDMRRIAIMGTEDELGVELVYLLGPFECADKDQLLARGWHKTILFDKHGHTYALGSTRRVWRSKSGSKSKSTAEQTSEKPMMTYQSTVIQLQYIPPVQPTTVLINNLPLAMCFTNTADREHVVQPFKLAGLLSNMFGLICGGRTTEKQLQADPFLMLGKCLQNVLFKKSIKKGTVWLGDAEPTAPGFGMLLVDKNEEKRREEERKQDAELSTEIAICKRACSEVLMAPRKMLAQTEQTGRKCSLGSVHTQSDWGIWHTNISCLSMAILLPYAKCWAKAKLNHQFPKHQVGLQMDPGRLIAALQVGRLTAGVSEALGAIPIES